MISTRLGLEGVSPSSQLYASSTTFAASNDQLIRTYQHIASFTRAVNHSYLVPLGQGDGNDPVTLGIDWSASKFDVLHVTAGTETGPIGVHPSDNFNGLTVAASSKIGNVWNQVGSINTREETFGERTPIDLLAPGQFTMLDLGTGTWMSPTGGTSFAAPLVTGAAALIEEYALVRDAANAPRWGGIGSFRHETKKAILMNSADKLHDDGSLNYPFTSTPIPKGRLLGMDRTVFTDPEPGQLPETWFASIAYNDFDSELIPLDPQMGAGHLNVRRAVQQFRNGEYDNNAADVPVIGWDFGSTSGEGAINKYVINQPLLGGSFLSATLAFDRVVKFDDDQNGNGFFDDGDTFWESNVSNPNSDDLINDLDILLMPKGATSTAQNLNWSISKDSTVDHIFFEIPIDGEYELWVEQWDDEATGGGQDYAIAWWAVSSAGDFNSDGNWDCDDLNMLSTAIASGSTDLTFDLDGDGEVTLADIRDQSSGWLSIGGALDTDDTSGLPYLPADANLDGEVGGTEFLIWNDHKFTQNSNFCDGDFDASGNIDGADFLFWNEYKFLSSATIPMTGISPFTAVPEPMGMLWLVVSVAYLRNRRR